MDNDAKARHDGQEKVVETLVEGEFLLRLGPLDGPGAEDFPGAFSRPCDRLEIEDEHVYERCDSGEHETDDNH